MATTLQILIPFFPSIAPVRNDELSDDILTNSLNLVLRQVHEKPCALAPLL